MPKPVMLTVDDDPEVLRAIERDLRGHYAERYRVMRANSGSAALTTLRELKARNNPVALLLADQRMPQMDGVGFLTQAMDIHPQAKRALLTAYADTNAAIDAINEARVHYYLMKPWDPPEEKLFPALDDLLHDWAAQFRPPYEGIRVLGPAAAPIVRLKQDYRYHFVLKSASRGKLNSLLRAMLDHAAEQKIPRTQVIVDVDAIWLM